MLISGLVLILVVDVHVKIQLLNLTGTPGNRNDSIPDGHHNLSAIEQEIQHNVSILSKTLLLIVKYR